MCALFLSLTTDVSAQWLTQSVNLKQGWNGVFLHVDASYDSLDNLIGAGATVPAPITEVWMWTPNPSTVQFVQSPQEPMSLN